MRRLQVGQIVDFVVAYNERQKKAQVEQEKEEKKGRTRKATQTDIDAFFG